MRLKRIHFKLPLTHEEWFKVVRFLAPGADVYVKEKSNKLGHSFAIRVVHMHIKHPKRVFGDLARVRARNRRMT